jgi:hypothetical protein
MDIHHEVRIELDQEDMSNLAAAIRRDVANQASIEKEQGFPGSGFPKTMQLVKTMVQTAFDEGRDFDR